MDKDTAQNLERTPFHMPGHKRNIALLGNDFPYAIDSTETAGEDQLHNPRGWIRDSMERAARWWGSRKSYFSVGGSTALVLAGVRALTQRGDTVLVARNCHISVWHACELCGLQVQVMEPEWLPQWGMFGAVTQAAFESARAKAPQAVLCVFTSPTYEGITSCLHTHGMPTFIDSAHGAHLPMPQGDLVAMSLHKTLPALTQTAVLHVNTPHVDLHRLEHQLQVFQSSSPSYVLLRSIERCLTLLEQHQSAWQVAWQQRLKAFYAHALRFAHLQLCTLAADSGKLLLRCQADEAAAWLRTQGIEPEYAMGERLLLMTSYCDSAASMAQLTKALKAYDAIAKPRPPANTPRPKFGAECVPMAKAVDMPHETVAAEQAVGRVSAEYVWACPPGIPMLLPGMQILEPPSGRATLRVLREPLLDLE